MAELEPILLGRLARQSCAADFAHEVVWLAERYARDVVAAFDLCPHLRDVETGFGAVCVVLDREPDARAIARAVRETGETLVHVVLPLTTLDAGPFSRFANAVYERLRGDDGPRFVHAAFHPEMEGGMEYPSRVIGLLRRSPDPFVQLIPTLPRPPSEAAAFLDRIHRRVRGDQIGQIAAAQAALRAERRRRYARFAGQLGPFSW